MSAVITSFLLQASCRPRCSSLDEEVVVAVELYAPVLFMVVIIAVTIIIKVSMMPPVQRVLFHDVIIVVVVNIMRIDFWVSIVSAAVPVLFLEGTVHW